MENDENCSPGRTAFSTPTLEINLVVPQKIGHSTDVVLSVLYIYPKDALTDNKNICSPMFIAVLFIIAIS